MVKVGTNRLASDNLSVDYLNVNNDILSLFLLEIPLAANIGIKFENWKI